MKKRWVRWCSDIIENPEKIVIILYIIIHHVRFSENCIYAICLYIKTSIRDFLESSTSGRWRDVPKVLTLIFARVADLSYANIIIAFSFFAVETEIKTNYCKCIYYITVKSCNSPPSSWKLAFDIGYPHLLYIIIFYNSSIGIRLSGILIVLSGGAAYPYTIQYI